LSSANLTTLEPAGYEYFSADLSTTAAPTASTVPVACTTREATSVGMELTTTIS